MKKLLISTTVIFYLEKHWPNCFLRFTKSQLFIETYSHILSPFIRYGSYLRIMI